MRPAAVAGAIQGKLGATPEGVEDVGRVCEQADISGAKSLFLKAVKGRGCFPGPPTSLDYVVVTTCQRPNEKIVRIVEVKFSPGF